MSELRNLHAHECTGGCERKLCGCYMNPCPYRNERFNSFVCGFCRIGVQGPKPKQDALESAVKEVAA